MSYVALIAAGPGEKDLLTVRAAGLLREADVVVADADAASLAEEIVDAERICLAVDDDGLPLAHRARASQGPLAAQLDALRDLPADA